jgi:hypothetical protein
MRDDGNRSQGIGWLRKNRPDLVEQVEAGDMSVHRACVIAGLRKEYFSVCSDPVKCARTLKKRFSEYDLEVLVALINKR